jgi:hypothetical protein
MVEEMGTKKQQKKTTKKPKYYKFNNKICSRHDIAEILLKLA